MQIKYESPRTSIWVEILAKNENLKIMYNFLLDFKEATVKPHIATLQQFYFFPSHFLCMTDLLPPASTQNAVEQQFLPPNLNSLICSYSSFNKCLYVTELESRDVARREV